MINGTLPPECKIRLKMVYIEFFLFVSFLYESRRRDIAEHTVTYAPRGWRLITIS